MPFSMLQGDITTLKVDAIVNAANSSLLGGGGVDGAIHRAAGPALREYCAGLGGCRVGQAKRSPGFDLPANWVIHTVGPIWQGGSQNEAALLAACYRNALALAAESGCSSVAFPLISAGAYGYPKDQALAIAKQEILAFLAEHEMDVTLVIYDKSSFQPSRSLISELTAYWERCSSASPTFPRDAGFAASVAVLSTPDTQETTNKKPCFSSHSRPYAKQAATCNGALGHADNLAEADNCRSSELEARLHSLDESFSQMLLRKIDERGMTDAACYKRANVDRKLFSKIRSDPNYRPSKPTAIAFAVALELPLQEARELLMKAGFALSHSNKFDVIIEYFLSTGNYDIYQINEALFAFDQALLGAG